MTFKRLVVFIGLKKIYLENRLVYAYHTTKQTCFHETFS